MVCAVGIGTELALNGATAHAFAHILYKALFERRGGLSHGKTRCTGTGRVLPDHAASQRSAALSVPCPSPVSPDFGLCHQKYDIAGGGERRPGVGVYAAHRRIGGVFLRRYQVSMVCVFQRDSGLRPKDAPWNMAPGHADFRGAVSADRVFPQYCMRCCPTRWITWHTPGKVVFTFNFCCFPAWHFSCCCR